MSKEENITNLLDENLSKEKLNVSDDIRRIIIIAITTFLVTQNNVTFDFVLNAIKNIISSILKITVSNSVDFSDTDQWIKRLEEIINNDK